jgi:hypothetical protein
VLESQGLLALLESQALLGCRVPPEFKVPLAQELPELQGLLAFRGQQALKESLALLGLELLVRQVLLESLVLPGFRVQQVLVPQGPRV